jgi:ketol-acid reductoisomerase
MGDNWSQIYLPFSHLKTLIKEDSTKMRKDLSTMDTNNTSIRFFTSKDASPDALDGERIAVIGYGNLGRPFALNLRDSGVPQIFVGNIADDYATQATNEGFHVMGISEAVADADIALILLPDEVIPESFSADIAPNLRPGSAIVFASGYTLAYGLIKPPAYVDVLMLAPRMAGENARQRFLNDEGFFAYVSVEQEASGKAWQRLLGLAKFTGILKAGALQMSAQQEADIDLFIEQSMGAALGMAILTAFTVGVDSGLPPEAMVMEMYMDGEMEMVFRSFREIGFFKASNVHGPTALYGGYVRTMELMQTDMYDRFTKVMEHIHTGGFANDFQAERQAGYPNLTTAMEMDTGEHPISQAEAVMRGMIEG